MSPQLKLIALDADDLAVISAHVQDAHVKAADIIWRAREKRLVIGMSRLDWEQAIVGEPAPRRLVAALRFDRVRHLAEADQRESILIDVFEAGEDFAPDRFLLPEQQ